MSIMTVVNHKIEATSDAKAVMVGKTNDGKVFVGYFEAGDDENSMIERNLVTKNNAVDFNPDAIIGKRNSSLRSLSIKRF